MSDDLEHLYREHAKTVCKYLLSLCHDEGLAEELTQETFYRAVYSIKTYNGKCKVSVWLCQIAKHVWYQELARKNKGQIQTLTEDLQSQAPTPEASLILDHEKMALYNAIHSLKDPMKEVVLMRLSGELSFAEIGKILGKSENWARVTFYRAKQKIMEVL